MLETRTEAVGGAGRSAQSDRGGSPDNMHVIPVGGGLARAMRGAPDNPAVGHVAAGALPRRRLEHLLRRYQRGELQEVPWLDDVALAAVDQLRGDVCTLLSPPTVILRVECQFTGALQINVYATRTCCIS